MTTIDYLIEREYQRLAQRLKDLAADAQEAAAQPRRFTLAKHLRCPLDDVEYSIIRIQTLQDAEECQRQDVKP